MNIHDLPERQLSPREPFQSIDDMVREDHARYVREHRKAELISESMAGIGEFWSQAHTEHAEHMMGALQRIIALPGITEAQRWGLVLAAARGLADEWATYMVNPT